MKLSQLIGERYKEKPADANLISHIFLLKGGYIRQVANGIYSILPLGKRILSKIENIIREEMNKIDGQEVLMPVVMPRELWEESGRYSDIGQEMVRFSDRTNHDMLLGMTHEEATVHLVRNEAVTHSKYPFMVYQIQTKFRDEPRSRGGLIRVREFTMKDAYSFHMTQEDLNDYYNICLKAYEKIFERVGIPEVISVGSDTGMMGGSVAHEFMLLCPAGEDTIAICDTCGSKANMEVAKGKINHNRLEESDKKEVETLNISTIEDLKKFFDLPESRFVKAAVFARQNSNKLVVVFIRGDYEVNEAKLRNLISENVFPHNSTDDKILCFGFVGPIGLENNEKMDILFDKSLEGEINLICGANKENYHIEGFSIERDIDVKEFVDVSKVNDGDKCLECENGKIKLDMGIEVGNIFQLGDKYTKSMNMTYNDADGKREYPIMGCYGIGVGRLMASVMEVKNDEYGPIWPISIAPWTIHICSLNNKKEEVKNQAFDIYKKLKELNYEVVIDDRIVNAGVQFADADLIGVPVRVVVSPKSLKEGKVEISTRDKSIKKFVDKDDAINEIEKVIKSLTRND